VKRPEGFDRPRAPKARREPARDSAAAPEQVGPGQGVPRTSVEPRRTAKVDRVATEPIVVVAPASATAVLDGPAASDGPVADAPRLDPRAAKRALKAAQRERRRYERHEVRRFTKRSRRRRLIWSVVAGSVVALVAVVAVGAYSPLMALREVRIEGAQRIPVATLQAEFAGIMSTPLSLIDSADVHEALDGFPLIETYATEAIPPGTLVVRIVERTPIGVVDTGSGLELVDAAGVVIDRPAERPEGQPLIEAEGGVAGAGFRAVAAVVRSLPAEVRAQLTHATAATADDVQLELTGGASVVWGSAEESAFKADVLDALMVAAPPETVTLYDVSAPNSPVWE
jgi:cell division protein FtsQ